MLATRAVLDGPESVRARDAAQGIGERLLFETSRDAWIDCNHERYPNRNLNGSSGYALAFALLAQATGEDRYVAALHAHLKRAARASGTARGLFDGIAGVRAVASIACAIEPRYDALVRRCDDAIAAHPGAAERAVRTWSDYDLISGWAGIRIAGCIGNQARSGDAVAANLTWLLDDPARACVPAAGEPAGGAKRWLGLAHGIAGVISALATTLPDPDARTGAAIRRAAAALIGCVRTDALRYAWPRAIEDAPETDCRSVWCVGSGGIAVALLQAAQRLRDERIAAFAIASLDELAAASPGRARATGPAICHGTMGLALVMFSAWRATRSEAYAAAARRFALHALDELEVSAGRCWSVGNDGARYDALGELNGLAGIAAGLLTLCGSVDAEWLKCHALAPIGASA